MICSNLGLMQIWYDVATLSVVNRVACRRFGDEHAHRAFGLLPKRGRESTGMQPRNDEIHKPRKRQFLSGHETFSGMQPRQGS